MKLKNLLAVIFFICCMCIAANGAEINIKDVCERSDYTVATNIKIAVDSEGENSALLLFRAKKTDIYGYFYYGVGFIGDNFVVQKCYGNRQSTLFWKNVGTVNDGIWHKIKAVAVDDKIEAFLDDKMLFTVYDNDITLGDIGTYSDGSNIEFSDIDFSLFNDPQGDYDNIWAGGYDDAVSNEAFLKISNVTFLDDENKDVTNDNIVFDKKLKFSCDISNENISLDSFHIIGAVYSDDSTLISCFIKNAVFDENKSCHIENDIVSADGKYFMIKLFAWDDVNTLVPISESEKIKEFNTNNYTVLYNHNVIKDTTAFEDYNYNIVIGQGVCADVKCADSASFGGIALTESDNEIYGKDYYMLKISDNNLITLVQRKDGCEYILTQKVVFGLSEYTNLKLMLENGYIYGYVNGNKIFDIKSDMVKAYVSTYKSQNADIKNVNIIQ